MANSNPEREPLEVLAAEYMDRLRQGQHPDIEEYAAGHPDLAEEIRELFPTIAVTERLKAQKERSSGGGMGVVFEAEQESLGRRVAVKVLPRQVLLDEKHLKRFEREARIAANLHHTNIVEVFGVGEQDGFHYYVMQYIHGVGLDALIPELARAVRNQTGNSSQSPGSPVSNTLPESESASAAARRLLGEDSWQTGRLGLVYWQGVARIGLQAADALSYAHSQGTLHRDIKPANLLLDTQGTVWLADFGLAKAAQSDDISLSNDLVGTLRYMAPEQFRGSPDHRSDIYSLGLTLYELLALRPAFEETDRSRLMQRITEGSPPAPGSVNREIPRDLETIIFKAINHEVSQRYQSAEAMAEDLRCFLEDRPIQARRVGPVERLGRWCRRNKRMAGLAGTSLFLLVLVAVVASVGYVQTKRALHGEALQRTKAEANAGLAIEALDQVFEQLSPRRMMPLPQTGGEGDFGEASSSPLLSKEAAALLEKMLPFYDRLAQQSESDQRFRTETADANRRVGAIRQRLGQLDEAAKAYQRALALYQQSSDGGSANPKLKLEMAQLDNELGRLYTARQQVAEARQAHRAALALLQGDASMPSAPAASRFELARTLYCLGTQERPLPGASQPEKAGPVPVPEEQRDNLAQAVTLLRALAAAAPANPEYQHLLALCYLEGATIDGTRPSQGRDERAIQILEALVATFPGIADYAYSLSEAYARIHIPEPPISPETQNRIEDYFGKSLALLEKLALKYPDVPDFVAAQARLQDKLGAFERQMERWPEAERRFHNAIALQASLVKQFPERLYYGVWMATFRIALADAMLHRNQPEQARAELEDAITTLRRQLDQRPEVKPPHDLLALGYSKLAIALRQSGEKDQADEAARKAEQERNSGPRSP
ncbi:MAG: serine/threonine-protein kinase [Verrucomicrobia bacterium]|nr:serine/threonine-protein kinase [Verrucomicrobiota bacterium]